LLSAKISAQISVICVPFFPTWYNPQVMIVLNTLQSYLVIILGVAGGLLLALWLAVVVWAYRDVRARSRSTAAAVLTVLLVLLLPVVGLVIYLLLRPRETLAVAYDRALEQEALLQQIEERPICPTCARPTQPNWFLCPACHTHLRQPCPTCNSPLELHWDICPYCGHLFENETTEVVPAVDVAAETSPGLGEGRGDGDAGDVE
jgi:hypothetical protein